MNKDRMKVGEGWCPMPRWIGRCCERGIEQIRMGGGRELVEDHLGCDCTGMRVAAGTPRAKEELEGGLGLVVWMVKEGKNSVNEVRRSIAKLAQYYERETS